MTFDSQIWAWSNLCQRFIKLSGYLPNNLMTWFMMSKMTPSSNSPVRNPPRPPSPKFSPDINHVGCSSNFQDIFLINYWHDLWYQRWPYPPSLQSGTLNVLHVPNAGQSAESWRILIKLSGQTSSSKYPVKDQCSAPNRFSSYIYVPAKST